ncbi:hypothetical protein IQ265_03915 [Nodosilinea sp. LEGE 06152]|uniref:hypothetical protein n=1 Tax=Nodosilinea sp. LEGE 06152 TaxID=2777966 RepID=UPI00187F6B21|nr:hypothetical protein [Nodosilinea sp. LEGE 06152]MBE9155981.1 hypothetical protein [Nodosilinea sp. LEGE 06152]
MKEGVQHAVLTLRQRGLSTPEICQQLSLDSDSVIEILLQGPVVPKPVTVTSLKRPVGRPQKLKERDLLASITEAIVGRRKEPDYLWTFPDLLQVVRRTLQIDISQDTLRRYLTSLGFTFDHQLKQVVGSLVSPDEIAAFPKGAMLYVVSHQLHQLGEDVSSRQTATLIIGVTAFNRIAVMARPQSRLSPGMLAAYLRGLLALHPDRNIAVILSGQGVYRSVMSDRALLQEQRLKLYLAKKGRAGAFPMSSLKNN